VVGHPQQDAHHLQDHGHSPQRPAKPPGGACGHGPTRWPRSANHHARVLGRTGSVIRWHLPLLRSRCPLAPGGRHAPRGPSRDRYELRHQHMSCRVCDTAVQCQISSATDH
jgi:hypothetical protein